MDIIIGIAVLVIAPLAGLAWIVVSFRRHDTLGFILGLICLLSTVILVVFRHEHYWMYERMDMTHIAGLASQGIRAGDGTAVADAMDEFARQWATNRQDYVGVRNRLHQKLRELPVNTNGANKAWEY